MDDALRPDSPLCAASHVNIPSTMVVLERVPKKSKSSAALPAYTAEAQFPVCFWIECWSLHLIYSKGVIFSLYIFPGKANIS